MQYATRIICSHFGTSLVFRDSIQPQSRRLMFGALFTSLVNLSGGLITRYAFVYVMFGALFTSLVNAYIEVPFARPLKVSEPCKGLGGFREFCEQGNLPYESVNAMDIEWRFRAFYEKLAAVNGKTYDVSGFHEVRGDVLCVDPADAASCDCLIAGPPCTPWALNGLRQGIRDPVAQVFLRVLDWLVSLSSRGLKMFALENSCEILTATEYESKAEN